MQHACERCKYWVLVGKRQDKRPLGWPSHRWEDNIKMDLKEIGWECVGWIHMAKDKKTHTLFSPNHDVMILRTSMNLISVNDFES
jgi:hypothetical protein